MIQKVTLLIFTLLIIISCGSNKNDNANNNKNNVETSQDPIILPIEQVKLEGFIRDPSGSPIMGVTIRIGNRQVGSNSAGFYSIPNIVQGYHILFVVKEGYVVKVHQIIISKTNTLNNMTLFKNTETPNIWVDKSTNLMWQDEANTPSEHGAYPNQDNHQKVGSWQYAKSYCTNLLLYYHNDWTLPSIEQLKDLYTKRSNLNNIAKGYYWSSFVTNKLGNNYVLYLNFGDGEYRGGPKSISAYIRCVRSTK